MQPCPCLILGRQTPQHWRLNIKVGGCIYHCQTQHTVRSFNSAIPESQRLLWCLERTSATLRHSNNISIYFAFQLELGKSEVEHINTFWTQCSTEIQNTNQHCSSAKEDLSRNQICQLQPAKSREQSKIRMSLDSLPPRKPNLERLQLTKPITSLSSSKQSACWWSTVKFIAKRFATKHCTSYRGVLYLIKRNWAVL